MSSQTQLPSPPPGVLAPRGVTPCRAHNPEGKGVYCERPKGHDGGHLSKSRDRYWQAEEPQS